MSTQTVSTKLVIGARDDASKVLSNVGKGVENVESTVTALGGTMGQAGAFSAEWLSSLVGPELKEFGDQLVNAKGLLVDFNEANVEGAKGLAIMKAGLVAAVAVGGFKLGQMLSGVKEDTRRLNEELARSVELTKQFDKLEIRRDAFEKFKISLAGSDKEKRRGLQVFLDEKIEQQHDAEKTLKRLVGEFKAATGRQRAARGRLNVLGLPDGDEVTEARRQLDEARSSVGKYTDQVAGARDEIKRFNLALGDAPRSVMAAHDAIRQQVKAIQKAAQEQQKALDAGHVAALADQLRVMTLGEEAAQRYRDIQAGISEEALAQGDAIRQQIKLMDEKKRIEEETAKIAEKAREAETRRREDLRKQADEIVNGKKRSPLDQFNELKKQLEDSRKSSTGGSGDLAAKESRFLSGRSSGLTEQAKQLAELKRQSEITEQMRRIQQQANWFLGQIAEQQADKVLT